MPVEPNDILHVLAHELRTPVGIAHGYVRLLLDDKLPQEADRRRALEQMQKALRRLSDLSQETTALASWYDEGCAGDSQYVDVGGLVDRIAGAPYEFPVTVHVTDIPDHATVRTPDPTILTNALISIVHATARELRGQPCTVLARVRDERLEMLTGPDHLLGTLGDGPTAAEASPLGLERGGLGLALVHAAVILDAHHAERWTMNSSRQTVGVRLPLERHP